MEWEKIYTYHITNMGLISRYIRNCCNLTAAKKKKKKKPPNNPV